MNKYIDAEKLIAEIERRLNIVEPYKDTFESAAACRQELIWIKDFISALQQEQKPAEWSEEDKKKLNGITNCLCSTSGDIDGFGEWYDWLKDLPNRFALQPKQDWSEEDSLHLTNAILCAETEWGVESHTAKWLKSLRPQPHSKPSKEQMEALMYATGEGGTYNKEALKFLLNDLKKRM